MNVDGTGLTQLTHSSSHDYNVAWLPDGGSASSRPAGRAARRALLRHGQRALFRMDRDGKNLSCACRRTTSMISRPRRCPTAVSTAAGNTWTGQPSPFKRCGPCTRTARGCGCLRQPRALPGEPAGGPAGAGHGPGDVYLRQPQRPDSRGGGPSQPRPPGQRPGRPWHASLRRVRAWDRPEGIGNDSCTAPSAAQPIGQEAVHRRGRRRLAVMLGEIGGRTLGLPYGAGRLGLACQRAARRCSGAKSRSPFTNSPSSARRPWRRRRCRAACRTGDAVASSGGQLGKTPDVPSTMFPPLGSEGEATVYLVDVTVVLSRTSSAAR